MTIAELKAKQGKVDIVCVVSQKDDPREFNKFGQAGRVCNAKVKDDSGEIALTLWNDQVDQVNVGDKIHITNGYVNEWQSQKQLTTGRFGKLEVLEKGDPSAAPKPAPKKDPDFADEDEGKEDSSANKEDDEEFIEDA